jgi:signal transduction histidine kinase
MRAVLAVRSEVNVEPEVALCVYRVSQEALRNAARHSGARAAHLALRTNGTMLELQIEDDGSGFEPAAAHRRGGLGLTSMAERVRLVGGTVEVDTAVGRGTRIFLRVPYRENHGSPDAPARG